MPLLARAWEGSSASCLVGGVEVVWCLCVGDDDEDLFERDISMLTVWSKRCQ